MTNEKRHFISRYEMAIANGLCTKEFAEQMQMPLHEVYWRANDYRKRGELSGHLKRCRQDQISRNEFLKIYMQAAVEGRDIVWITKQTGQTKNAVKCLTYSLRKSGTVLPPLNKSKDKRAVLRDYLDIASFI